MGGRGREITTVKVATLSCLAYSHFHLFLYLKKHLTRQKFHEHKEVKNKIISWLRVQAAEFCDIEYKNSYPGEAP